MEVSLLTGFYPNQDDLKQVKSRAGDGPLETSYTSRVGAEHLSVGQGPQVNAPTVRAPRSVAMVNFSLTSALIVPQFPQHLS